MCVDNGLGQRMLPWLYVTVIGSTDMKERRLLRLYMLPSLYMMHICYPGFFFTVIFITYRINKNTTDASLVATLPTTQKTLGCSTLKKIQNPGFISSLTVNM